MTRPLLKKTACLYIVFVSSINVAIADSSDFKSSKVEEAVHAENYSDRLAFKARPIAFELGIQQEADEASGQSEDGLGLSDAPTPTSSSVTDEVIPPPVPNASAKRNFEINDQPLNNALEAISSVNQKNYIVSPGASQRNVRLMLKNVTTDQALDVLLKTNGLWLREDPKNENIAYIYLESERESIPIDIKDVEKQINETFPDSVVILSKVGSKVVVRGEAKDSQEAKQILNVIGGLYEAQTPGPVNISVSRTERQQFGSTKSLLAEANAQDAVPEMLNKISSNIVNLLTVPGPQQVMLRVIVAEIDREAVRELGVDTRFLDAKPNGNKIDLRSSLGSTSNTGILNLKFDTDAIDVQIKALRQLSLARTLAEPNLTAMNGQLATFNSGGRFPIPVVGGNNNGGNLQGVEFVPFGIRLNFIPNILGRERIRLSLSGEISDRDAEQLTSVGGDSDVGGTAVPEITTQNFETTVELRDGQTLAIAGLIRNDYLARGSRFPFFGDIPIIGRAAASDTAESLEKELVVLVTPELVHPLEKCERPALPGSDVFEPNDVEFYLMGRLESRRAQDFRTTVRSDPMRRKRYYECNDRFIIGASGFSDDCNCAPSSAFQIGN